MAAGSRDPFRVHRGRVAPLRRNHVDTDQIIPKQFLKRIERTGFGPFLFYDWRRGADGQLDPAFKDANVDLAKTFIDTFVRQVKAN